MLINSEIFGEGEEKLTLEPLPAFLRVRGGHDYFSWWSCGHDYFLHPPPQQPDAEVAGEVTLIFAPSRLRREVW